MDLKETGKKLKPFAPVLSVAVVASCVAGTLSGYQPPVYAAQEQTNSVKEETTKSEEQEQAVKGSFDLTDGIYKGTGTGYAGDITVAVQIKDRQITAIDILSSSDDAAFFKRAQAVIDKIIEGQTLEVDTVSGATYSSRGIISAVKNALTGEKDSGTKGQSQSGGGAAAGSSTSVATVEDPAAYKDGTYYGTGTGFGGTLKVKVEISGGKITDIQIMENQDGSEYISKASALINAIISSQSTNVDTVSGATYSSVGIIQAVRDALSQAAVSGNGATSDSSETNGSNSSSSQNQSTSTTGTVPYKEGIYYGTAEGYSGDVSVAVVIQDHTIKAILVTETSDDEAFFNRAMDVVKNVLKNQNTDVDTVSGATYSSKGLLGAIKNALKQAEKVTNGESIEEKADTTELENAVKSAEALVMEEYTQSSWAVLSLRLNDAKELLETAANETVEQQTVDKAVENLNLAVAQLEKKKSDQEEEVKTKYIDGTYEVSVPCKPDEDEDFTEYQLSMKVTIRNDKIVSITDVSGDGDAANDSYIKKAANGTSSKKGVVSQIITKGMPEEIDTVSRATCSSNAIIDGCKKALEMALRQKRRRRSRMKEFIVRLFSLLAIVGVLFGYNEVLDVRAKDEEIAKLNAQLEVQSSGAGSDSESGSDSGDGAGYKDGTYTGEADGFGGTVAVEVTVKDGKIEAVEVTSAEKEDSAYLAMAEDIIPKIIEAQSAEVDTISGATFSSTGIKNAAEQALEQAVK